MYTKLENASIGSFQHGNELRTSGDGELLDFRSF